MEVNDTVFLVKINHESFDAPQITLHSTFATAEAHVAEWCKDDWENECDDLEIPHFNDEIISMYFDRASDCGNAWYTIDAVVVRD